MQRRRSPRWTPPALALAAALAAAPAAAEHHVSVHWSGDLGYGYDDNVGAASGGADVRDTGFASAGLNLDYGYRPTLYTGLLLRGSLRGDAYEQFEGLSSAKLSGMARLSHRPAGGFYMPTFAGWVAAGLWEFDSRLRDSVDYRAGAYVVEPLTTAISARLGVTLSERRAQDDVFDLSSWSAGLNLDWMVLPSLTVYGSYQRHDGDIVSSASAYPKSHEPESETGGYPTVDAPDDALDGLVAYRVPAETDVVSLGFNVPVSSRLALDAQLMRIGSDTDFGVGYDRLQGLAGVLLRF